MSYSNKYRIGTDIPMQLTLTDSGVNIDWNDVTVDKVAIYNDDQEAFAGLCSFSINSDDSTLLDVTYDADDQVYLGDCRLIVIVTTEGAQATYDAEAFALVATSEEATGIPTTDDPAQVGISVTNVPSSTITEILNACITATAACEETEESVEAAEALRVTAEQNRVNAESARVNAESARVNAESARVSAESARVNAESARVSAENARVNAESARVNAESDRVSKESARVSAESARANAESARVSAESARVNAESLRVSAESARVNAESARVSAESARVNAEGLRVNAESARVTAEQGRVDAEAARVLAEQARVDAEAARQATIDAKADKDGYSPNLRAGAADNLVDELGVALSGDVLEPMAAAGLHTGRSLAKYLEGRTLVWNQLVTGGQTHNGLTATLSDGVFTISGVSAATYAAPIVVGTSMIVGHKYIFLAQTIANPNNISFRMAMLNQSGGSENSIFTANSVGNSCGFLDMTAGTDFTGVKVQVSLIDLTLMYGSGNEPASVSDFVKVWPRPYYSYDEHSLLNMTATGLKATGVNQWDEEWEEGSISASTGTDVSGSSTIRSVNYCKCLANTSYCLHCQGSGVMIFWYDADKNFISNANSAAGQNKVVTSPSNAAYFRLRGYDPDYGTSYNHDICINISNADINGQYFPYESHTCDLSWIYDLEDDNGVKRFADGLKSVGTAADYAEKDYAANVVGTQSVTGSTGDTITLDGCDTSATDYVCASGDIGTLSGGVLTLTADVSAVDVLYALATPVLIKYDAKDLSLLTNEYGIIAAEPTNGTSPTTAPVSVAIVPAPEIGKALITNTSTTNLLDALKTAGVISAYSVAWDEGTRAWTFSITA